jgi:hypothetical protein
MPQPPQLALSKAVLVQTPLQYVPPPGHPPHVPWLQTGVGWAQTCPQAPQFCGSELTLVHVPLQQSSDAAQQSYVPQLPQRRLALPLHARQAVRH